MIGGLDAFALVIGGIFGIMVGIAAVLAYTHRCNCIEDNNE